MAANLATTKMIQNILDGTTTPQQATKAVQDGSGNNIESTYAKQNGSYPNMTVGNATSADTAASATKATQDGSGNNIANTYATKSELSEGLAGKQPAGDYALQNGIYPSMTVGNATNAANATNATNDSNGNNIAGTYPVSIQLTINSETYVITAQLKNAAGENVGTAQSIDLPLESVVVSGEYNEETKSIVLTLENGTTIDIPVGDLIDGLATQTSVDNIVNGTTPVGNASNVTTNINGHAISVIFESDGTTVKQATNAANAATAGKVSNALTITVNGNATTYNGSEAKTINIDTAEGVDAITLTIPTSKWSGKSAILTATDYPAIGNVTAASTIQLIAADNSAATFITNGINLTAQAVGSVTISCEITPTASVSGTLMIFN